MRSITFINHKPIIYDFGLTIKNYTNNMFNLEICNMESGYINSLIYMKNFKNQYKLAYSDYNKIKGGLSDREIIKQYIKTKPSNNTLIYVVGLKSFIPS